MPVSSICLLGDSLEVLKDLPDNSVDSVVTDPPYGLAFMGKKWDYDVPSVELWREVLRVLKPGGHLLSFGGTRTYHRMVVAIEDAGFEIRDQVMWIYGSGFPKSMDVSKAIDKAAEREVLQQRFKNGDMRGPQNFGNHNQSGKKVECNITAPATDAAKQWQGWGTALKPANEPIVLARKPLSESTVAKNVLKWGCGALNVDASRIGYSENENIDFSRVQDGNIYGSGEIYGKAEQKNTTALFKPGGRWPANLILDEAAAAVLDEKSGVLKNGGQNKTSRKGDGMFLAGSLDQGTSAFAGDSGGASRFFYVAKASRRERGEGNGHPTVKPIKLMEYLVRMITPPGGVVLDPFMGSGTTGCAAINLGFDFIGIEREAEYLAIAEKRIDNYLKTTDDKDEAV